MYSDILICADLYHSCGQKVKYSHEKSIFKSKFTNSIFICQITKGSNNLLMSATHTHKKNIYMYIFKAQSK